MCGDLLRQPQESNPLPSQTAVETGSCSPSRAGSASLAKAGRTQGRQAAQAGLVSGTGIGNCTVSYRALLGEGDPGSEPGHMGSYGEGLLSRDQRDGR